MRIMQLGKSSATPSCSEYNVGYLIDLDGDYLLLESPPSIINQLNNAGINTNRIKWVYISHRHGDHILGIPMLLVDAYARKNYKTWNICIHRSLRDKIVRLIHIVYPELDNYIDQYVRFHILTPDCEEYITEQYSLTITPALHGVESFAVRISSYDKSVVYTGDTGYSDKIILLAENANLLIHETGAGYEKEQETEKHSTAYQAGMIANKANCEKLWLTHLNRFDKDFIARSIQTAQLEFNGQVDVVKDYEWIHI